MGWGQGSLRAFTSASSPKIPAPWLTLDNQEELGQRQGVHVSVPQARYPSIPSEGQQETPPVVVGAEPQEVTPPPQHRPPSPPPTLEYDRNRIFRPDTGMEAKSGSGIAGKGMLFQNSGSGKAGKGTLF